RRTRVCERGQIVILDLDQPGTSDSSFLTFRCHQRHFITLEAHDIATKDWLVGIDKPVGIVGYITCSQHSYHSRFLKSSARINCQDARVRAMSEDDLQMEHAGSH